MSEFLEMGGYAAYVWPAYLLTAAVLGAVAWVSVSRLKRIERALERMGTAGGAARRGGRAGGSREGEEAAR